MNKHKATKTPEASLRERERVKSLRDFSLEFFNLNNKVQDTIFNGVFLFYKKVENKKVVSMVDRNIKN